MVITINELNGKCEDVIGEVVCSKCPHAKTCDLVNNKVRQTMFPILFEEDFILLEKYGNIRVDYID